MSPFVLPCCATPCEESWAPKAHFGSCWCFVTACAAGCVCAAARSHRPAPRAPSSRTACRRCPAWRCASRIASLSRLPSHAHCSAALHSAQRHKLIPRPALIRSSAPRKSCWPDQHCCCCCWGLLLCVGMLCSQNSSACARWRPLAAAFCRLMRILAGCRLFGASRSAKNQTGGLLCAPNRPLRDKRLRRTSHI